MRALPYLGLLLGIGLLLALMIWQGFGTVLGLLLETGWVLLLLPLVWLPMLLPATASWRLLFLPGRAPRFGQALHALWMGRAVNTLLPVASIGGEVVKARVLILWGVPGADATASVVVDKTVQVFAVVLWGLISTALLFLLAADDALAAGLLASVALLAAGAGGFLVAQRAGMFSFVTRLTAKLTDSDFWHGLAGSAAEVDAVIRQLYRRGARVTLSTALRLLAFSYPAVEVWLAATLLGFPIGFLEAMFLRGLSSTMSDAAFFVPNAYGVQEGAYIALGALIGMPAETALALSLATRVRELVVDLPGVLAWQHAEGRALLRRRGAA